jgi:hypothetical protein
MVKPESSRLLFSYDAESMNIQLALPEFAYEQMLPHTLKDDVLQSWIYPKDLPEFTRASKVSNLKINDKLKLG